MKRINLIIMILSAVATLTFQACQKNEPRANPQGSILPSKFKVDIPNSMSSESGSQKMGSISGKTGAGVDTIQGDQIYQHLRTFIAVGEGAGAITEGIILAIKKYDINKAMSLSFTSQEDGRTKNVEVIENSFFDGKQYEFEMTITDALSENEPDGGNALQVFWDRSPIVGIAILKPYNINRTKHSDAGDAIFKIEYGEDGAFGYDAHMIVSIAGLPLLDPLVNPYSMETLRMFVGKTGTQVDVYGNSNHPNARFVTNQTGFNWAFVASGDETQDIAVAEVGLPISTLNSSDRTEILVDNSIEQVLSDQIYAAWPNIDSASVAAFLHNTGAPGYFNTNGFIQGEVAPSAQYQPLEASIQNLAPYNPNDVTSLSIEFK